MSDAMHLKLTYVESPTYATRIRGIFIVAIAIPAAMGTLGLIFAEWIGLCSAMATLSLLQALNQNGRSRYFITRYEVQTDQVEIDFTDRGINRTVTGDVGDFSAKKRAVLFQRGTEPYLAIYHKEKLLVKQYQCGGWDEYTFDAIVVSLGGKVTSGMLLDL